MIVKLAFEMSKKMLPTQVTRMRAWVVGVLGMATDCVPSLGVEATRLLKVARSANRCHPNPAASPARQQ